jgi:spore maturation protein A
MLNYIWFGLMAIALVVAIFNGTAPQLTKAAVDSARVAVEISLGLVGIMTLWLGIMRIAEKAGLIALLACGLKPISRVLFPEIPPGHPAIGAMIMAVAANMLGLNNAATPLGIKAMEELQALNPLEETASNAMVTFMVINTSGIQFIPATIIGVLAAAGAANPTSIIAPTLLSTTCGAVAAVSAAKLLQRFFPTGAATVVAPPGRDAEDE